MSRLRSVKSGPQESSHVYRESLIDPQAPSTSYDQANVKHSCGSYPASVSLGSRSHNPTCNACGNTMQEAARYRISPQRQASTAGFNNSHESHTQARPTREGRIPPPTLDDVDIEALISAYRPMLHPTVRESLEDQYSVIEASRRERETRLAFAASAAESAGQSPRSRARSTQSTASGSTIALQLPSATSNPLQSAIITRSSSAPTGRPFSSKSHESSMSRSKTSFLSGEILTEDFERSTNIAAPPAMQRATSQSSYKSALSGRSQVPIGNNGGARPGLSAFLSGSIPHSDKSGESSRPSTSSRTRTPLSSPPVSAVPTRFTQSSAVNTGPGSLYTGREVNPFFSTFVRKGSENANSSPRSSVSSKSNNPSLRWSSGSAKTNSSSRHTPHSSYNTDEVVIISNPPGSQTATAVDAREQNPATFSWLSFEEEEGYRQNSQKSEDEAPVMERKNSLWRESLDSIASSRFEFDDKDDVLAHHFPPPPVMSRSNSVATTMTLEPSFHTPPEFDDIELSPNERSIFESTPVLDLSLGRFEESLARAPQMARKASISEMLKTHIVSPLSRSRSKSSSKGSSKESSNTIRPIPTESGSSRSSSSSSFARPPLPSQGLCLA